jgi:NCAIR mutase (PurE)-related protein
MNPLCGSSSTTSVPASSPPTMPPRKLRRLPFADLGFARVDHHRRLRQRVGEAVYAPGKTPEQCALIVQ